MDQVVSDRLRAKERLERIVEALHSGIILLDGDGRIAWADKRTRSRLNGGMDELVKSLQTSDKACAMDCSVTAVDVTINGERGVLGLIQATDDNKQLEYDLVAAIEADSSWFTRTIIDKLKALRQTTRSAPRSSDLDLLTDREREVLGLICEGRSDADMGKILCLSQNTVRNHIASLYRKIGVNRRSAAIIWARERAITPQDTVGLARRKRAPNHPQQ
jgi:DNA-binding CsgD family transcriptional regulator